MVDGGQLVFVRPAPDNALVQGLWTLLPHSLRPRIFPATFAFSNTLGFDVVVVPRLGDEAWEGYTTEDQAADYPAGSYELALQTAAEAGDQAELDRVFARRTSGETLRLAGPGVVLGVLAIVVAVAIARATLPSVPVIGATPCLAAVAIETWVTLLASWSPARRAGSSDPLEVLRAD